MKEQDKRAVEGMARCGISLEGLLEAFPKFDVEDVVAVYDEVNKIKTSADGIKFKDACHVASAILASADYFISTDYRLLKYATDDIKIMNPLDFIRDMEE